MKKNLITGNPLLDVLGMDTGNEEISKKPAERKREKESASLDGVLSAEKKPETKSKRLNLLIKPSLLEKAQRAAAKGEVSVNELINRILEDYLK